MKVLGVTGHHDDSRPAWRLDETGSPLTPIERR